MPLHGSHVVTVAAPDTSATRPTEELLDRFLPGVPVLDTIAGHSSVVDSTACARLLGFRPRRTWRTQRT